MWGTFNKKTKKKGKYWISLILDIRSSSVGASIVKNFKGKNKIPVILATYREQIFYTDKPKTDEFITKSYQTINRVLDIITEKKHDTQPVFNCFVFYGSPWYGSEIRSINVTEKKAKTLKKDFLEKTIKDSYIDTPVKKMIEQKCLSVSVNGYKAKNPFDKKFKKLKIDFIESFLHEDTYNDINEIVIKKTNLEDIKHSTHPITMHTVLSEKFEPVDNYTILDISGEITEMTIVKKDEIKKTVTIPHGSHFFVRGLAKKCNLDFMNSFSKLDMILNEEVNEKCEENSLRAFKDMKVEWADEIREVMKRSNIKSLPHDVFVLVDNEVVKLTRNILKDSEIYSGALKFKKKPNLNYINSIEMDNLCVYRTDVKKDAVLSLESSFVEMYE